VAWGARLPLTAVHPVSTPPPNETGCKVARLHNTCIYSVASHSWVKLHHSLNDVLCHPEFFAPKYPAGHPKLLQLETPPVYSAF